MSWGLAISSTKLLVSYLVPHRIRVFREAIFDGNVVSIQQLAEERPRLLRRPIDGDGNTALGVTIVDSYFLKVAFLLCIIIIRFSNSIGRGGCR